ncbi:MAG TPA: YegS/Rv2252/BmrU family lipid kinase [Gemmatimonadaceae bacterium]|nr:YegS/Rv2252/BmrU family lipid kinase [Gemmatimonadaceae bacterium]
MDHHRHYALIVHGARADLPSLRHVVGWVRAKGHTVDVRVTWEQGDATRFARDSAARDGVAAVIAAGGDGTVNEVLNGLAESDVPLGILPVGTANDFARQAGIPLDADHAMDVILRRKPTRVDTLELNGRRFLNVSTGGVGAEATADTPAEAKESLGMLAYAITGARKLRELAPRRARVTAPGFEFDGDFVLFAVGNARLTGGGVAITPRATMTDGLLDFCLVEPMPRAEFARLALRIRRGEHLEHPGVHYAQLPSVRVAGEEAISVNVDGEPSDGRVLEYRVRKGDLLLHVVRLPGDEG